MKKIFLSAFTLCMSFGTAFGQQALFGGQMPLSPEIHADKTVTFRCMAPNAQKVQITGDFLPTKKIDTPMGQYDAPGVVDLTKDDKGVWSYTTTSPLPSELYSYTMTVDGASVTDHLNVYTVRDISNVSYSWLAAERPISIKSTKCHTAPFPKCGMKTIRQESLAE